MKLVSRARVEVFWTEQWCLGTVQGLSTDGVSHFVVLDAQIWLHLTILDHTDGVPYATVPGIAESWRYAPSPVPLAPNADATIARFQWLLDEDKNLFFDTILEVGGAAGVEQKQIKARRAVLALGSPFFRAAFDSGMTETAACGHEAVVRFPEDDPATFKLLLKFMYGGTPEIDTWRGAISLVVLANKLGVEALLTAATSSSVELFLPMGPLFGQANPLLVIDEMRQHGDVPAFRDTIRSALNRVTAKDLADVKALCSITADTLEEVVSDCIVQTDFDLFTAVLQWTKENLKAGVSQPEGATCLSAGGVAARFVQHLDLKAIEPSSLVLVVKPSGFVPAEDLLQAYEAQLLTPSPGKPLKSERSARAKAKLLAAGASQ